MRGYLQEFWPYGMGAHASGFEQKPCTYYTKREAALYHTIEAGCRTVGYHNSFADRIRSKQAKA